MGRKNRERETNEKEKKDIVSWFSLFIAIISMFVSVWSANESTKIAKTDRRVDTYTKAIVSLDTLSFREWITEEGYGEIFNGEVDDQWVKDYLLEAVEIKAKLDIFDEGKAERYWGIVSQIFSPQHKFDSEEYEKLKKEIMDEI